MRFVPKTRFSPQIEGLEERAVPANFYTVGAGDFADGNGVLLSGSGISSDPYVYSTLRGAINAANGVARSTVTLPAGTFTLTIGNATTVGELDITASMTIMGVGPRSTFIQQTIAGDRIINSDPLGNIGNIALSISGVTIEGGDDTTGGLSDNGDQGDGGGGILAGGPFNTLILNDDAFLGNSSTDFGGAVACAAGALSVTNCQFGGPSSGQGNSAPTGGALMYASNSLANGDASSDTFTVSGCSFIDNVAADYGGGIWMTAESAGDTIVSPTITDCNFVGNQANSTTSAPSNGSNGGGAINNKSQENVTVGFCRFIGNTAEIPSNGNTLAGVINSPAPISTITANDNWWGSNAGPSSNDTDGDVTVSTYLVLTLTASPTTINAGQNSALTADFIHNNLGTNVAGSDPAGTFPAFSGGDLGTPALTVSFGSPVEGTVSGQQATIQAGGTATATFTGVAPGGAGSASVTVDGVTSSANIGVDSPPTVNTNPPNTTVNSGSNTTITAVIDDGFPVPTTYQWQISTDGGTTWNNLTNTSPYSTVTSQTLHITGATSGLNGDEYQLVAGNANFPNSATTSAATLTVDFAPVISTDPTDQTVNAGGNTSFTASATGQPIPTVQWQVSSDGGTIFTNVSNGVVYSGATSDTLSLTGVTTALNGDEYQAIFSNTLFGAGSPSKVPSSPATLTVAPVVSPNAASILATATTLTINGIGFDPNAADDSVTFSGGATGTVSSATATTLSITGISGLTGGPLSATVTSGGATSSPAVQVATVVPVVTNNTNSLLATATTLTIDGFGFDSNTANDQVTVPVGVNGVVSAATNTTLTITALTGLTGGPLSVTVTVNSVPSNQTQVATVTPVVTPGASILTTTTTSLTIDGFGFDSNTANDQVAFNGSATGTITAATATTLTVTGLTGLNVGSLLATVTVNGIASSQVQVATVSSNVVITDNTPGDTLTLMQTTGTDTVGDITYVLGSQAPVTLTGVTSYTYNGAGGQDTMIVEFPTSTAGVLVTGTVAFNSGADGTGILTAEANGKPLQSQPGGIVVGNLQKVTYTNVATTNINSAASVNTIYGPDTADRTTAFSYGLSGQERFVQALYLDELGRAGAISELDAWVKVFQTSSLKAVANDIAHTEEATDHLVKTWYQTYLGRAAENGEEMGFVNELMHGATEESVLSSILGSPEFFNHAQTLVASGTAQQRFVQSLYQLLLGRQGGASELAGWVGALPQIGQAGVAFAILESQECRTNLVEGYYNALLHRPADLPGLDGWALSNLDYLTIRIYIEASDEFFTNG